GPGLTDRSVGRGPGDSEPGDYRIFLTPRDPEDVLKVQQQKFIKRGQGTACLELADPEQGLVSRCKFTGMGIHNGRAVHYPAGVLLEVEFYYMMKTIEFGNASAATARTGPLVLAHEALHSKPIPSNYNETLVRDR